MTGIKDRSFAPLPGNLSLEDLVPKENFYRRLHDVLDLSFVSVEEVYDQRKLEVVDEIFAADFTLHDPDLPRGARGPEGIKRIVETFVDAKTLGGLLARLAAKVAAYTCGQVLNDRLGRPLRHLASLLT